jgi:AcrR family transcriptional regulator
MISHFLNLRVKDNILTRKERERLFRKQEIIDASVKLFAGKGFNNTTLDDIAASSEFGKGTIYNYFSSKEEIYSAIVEDVSKNLKQIINQADKAAELASDFVKTYTSSLFYYCLSNKEAFKLFVREIVPFTTDLFILNREKILRRNKSARNILTNRFSEGIEKKEFKGSDPDRIVSLYQHLVFPYILNLIESPKKDLDKDSEINFVLEVFFKGILLKNKRL